MQVKQLLTKLFCRAALRQTQLVAGRGGAIGLGLLMMTGGVLIAESAVRPQVAQAYKSRVDVRLPRLADETYESMIRRAELIARAAAQRSFDRDILMSEVSVMVLGEYQGTEAPLLLLEVSRQNWRERPDTRRWATYYRTAKRLLKLPSSPDPVIPNAVQQPIVPNLPQIQPAPAPVVQPLTESPTLAPPVPVQPARSVPVPVPSAPASTGQPLPPPATPATVTPPAPAPTSTETEAVPQDAATDASDVPETSANDQSESTDN